MGAGTYWLPRQLSMPPREAATTASDERYRWDTRPYIRIINDRPREFFTIGHLAAALFRSTKTVRAWEISGLFPKPVFTVNGADPRKRRRLYTREQIEGVVKIAEEEGVLDSRRRYLTQTRFPERCQELFMRLGRELPPPLPEQENA